MVTQYAPDITEEEKAMVARLSKFAEEVRKNPPAGYFRGDRHAGDGIECGPPGTKLPETLYERMRRTGEIPY
ncbi:MAG: hypothetical protein HQL66_13495 [Magnetococcales bacterium]|nr:hypothetical protein [Magnetococcales bacterium]